MLINLKYYAIIITTSIKLYTVKYNGGENAEEWHPNPSLEDLSVPLAPKHHVYHWYAERLLGGSQGVGIWLKLTISIGNSINLNWVMYICKYYLK